MALKIFLLICAIFFVTSSTKLDEDDRPSPLIVTPNNRKQLGVPLGTILTKDKKTQRYEPPPLSDKFTLADRIKLIWTNDETRDFYCKVGPDLPWTKIVYKYYYHTWCKDEDNNDLCCGELTCLCNALKYDCDCV